MMSRRFRRYRGGLPPVDMQPEPSMLSSLTSNMPSLGSSPTPPPPTEKKGLLGLGMFGMGGGKSRRRRTSKRSSQRKSSRRRRR